MFKAFFMAMASLQWDPGKDVLKVSISDSAKKTEKQVADNVTLSVDEKGEVVEITIKDLMRDM